MTAPLIEGMHAANLRSIAQNNYCIALGVLDGKFLAAGRALEDAAIALETLPVTADGRHVVIGSVIWQWITGTGPRPLRVSVIHGKSLCIGRWLDTGDKDFVSSAKFFASKSACQLANGPHDHEGMEPTDDQR